MGRRIPTREIEAALKAHRDFQAPRVSYRSGNRTKPTLSAKPRPKPAQTLKATAERLGATIAQARMALALWTGTEEYLKAVVDGTQRIDLDGTEVEPIKSHHRAFAQGRLYERAQTSRRGGKGGRGQ